MPNLRDSLSFQQRSAPTVAEGLNRPARWPSDPAQGYVVAAEVLYLKGTEAVQAARLQGDQPAVITIRNSAQARAIDNTWRAVDARNPARVFTITSAALGDDRTFVQVLAVQKRGDVNG